MQGAEDMTASEKLAHTLVPVVLAAELVWARVYEGQALQLGKEALLDAIAGNLMVPGDIYEFDKDPSLGVRKLARSEIEGGAFRRGAKELHLHHAAAQRAARRRPHSEAGLCTRRSWA